MVLRLHISVALQQQTASFKVAFGSRKMQWSATTEQQRNESTCTYRVWLQKNTNNHQGKGNHSIAFASTSALHWSKSRDASSWPWTAHKCSGVPSLNKCKRIKLRKQSFDHEMIMILKAGALTIGPSPAHQRCIAATDGKFQSGLCQQKNAVECYH